MAVKNPQFELNLRKNTNANNPGYGKYYPKAKEKKTISQQGLVNHMAGHNCIYGRDIIDGVVQKLKSCLVELLSQGNPVKIDGLGTFVPKVESTKEGITRAALLEGKWNAANYIVGIHIRFIPENEKGEEITSRKFKEDCSLELTYVVGGESVTRGTGADATTEFVPNLVAYDAWQKLPAENDGHVGS